MRNAKCEVRNGGTAAQFIKPPNFYKKGVLGRFQTLCAPSTITHYALRITHFKKLAIPKEISYNLHVFILGIGVACVSFIREGFLFSHGFRSRKYRRRYHYWNR